MADFNIAYRKIQGYEGGWCNVSGDAGGETYAGVARNYFPNWPGWTYIDRTKDGNGTPHLEKLAPEQRARLEQYVSDFYREQFWNRFLGSAIPGDMQLVANELLDSAVNMGVHAAVAFLQKAVNALNTWDRSKIAEDGEVGNETLYALLEFPAKDALVLTKAMNILQGARYLELIAQSPAKVKFARGWLTRVEI
jgi:lysozyme family protein